MGSTIPKTSTSSSFTSDGSIKTSFGSKGSKKQTEAVKGVQVEAQCLCVPCLSEVPGRITHTMRFSNLAVMTLMTWAILAAVFMASSESWRVRIATNTLVGILIFGVCMLFGSMLVMMWWGGWWDGPMSKTRNTQLTESLMDEYRFQLSLQMASGFILLVFASWSLANASGLEQTLK
jgi:hypothetical protein